jgi:hypothetical protein
MRKKISIIFGHYSETKERDAISIRCVEALQQFRTPDTELIIVANGYYNNKIKFLCDVYCERVGSDCVAMTRSQYEDIGRFDEVYLHSDFVNYVNRWIAKGYAVTMTKRRMGKHVAFGTNSYHQQRSQFFNVKGYQGKQMLSRDDLIRATFREHLPALKTLYDYWN